MVRFLVEARNDCLLQIVLTDSGAHLPSYALDSERFPSGDKVTKSMKLTSHLQLTQILGMNGTLLTLPHVVYKNEFTCQNESMRKYATSNMLY